MADIFVSDYAGAVDVVSTTEMLTKLTVISLTSRSSLNTSFASSITAGQPMQGNMRQLAPDRWNYMYPS